MSADHCDELTDQARTAISLALAGIPVFPCDNAKKPLCRHGFKDATTDPDQVHEWWCQYPYAVPGVPTGQASGLFALDIDRKKGKDGFATLASMGVEVPVTRTHKTQSGGAHILFDMPKGVSLKNTVDELGSGLDTRADGGYIVWWPANGLPVENADAGILPMPQWLLDAVTAKPAPAPSATPSPSSAVAEGGRNDHLFRLASGLRGKGLSEAAIEAALLAENRARCSPPLPDAEVRTIAASTSRYEEGTAWKPSPEATAPAGFTFVPVRDLLSQPAPVDWLIRDTIEAGSLCQLFGASTAGKSFVALDWCASVATGQDWAGKPTKAGTVFYIAGEGHKGLGRRMRAWELHHGTALADAPLFFSTAPAALMDAGNAANVAGAVEALAAKHGAPGLIVVDTLARNLGNGEENSNADLGVFINNIDVMLRRKFGCAVLIVHHTGWQETQRSRGGSALRAAMDHEFRLDAFEGGRRELHVTKNKEGEVPPPMPFELQQVPLDGWVDDDGEVMTSAVLVTAEGTAAETPAKRGKLTGANKIALDALMLAMERDGGPPDAETTKEFGLLAPRAVVHEAVWRQRAYDSGITDGSDDSAKRKAFGRARKALIDMGIIATWKDQYWRVGHIPVTYRDRDTNGTGTGTQTGQDGTYSLRNVPDVPLLQEEMVN